MKRKTIELDVDFIGGENPMTKDEEEAVNEFIRTQKILRANKLSRNKKSLNSNKTMKSQHSNEQKMGDVSKKSLPNYTSGRS